MSDFTFLRGLNGLEELAGYCNNAENLVESDPSLSAIYARKAVEFLIKYIYKKKGAKFAYNAPLFELMNGEIVRELLDDSIMQQLHMVRFIGNNAAHNQKVNKTESLLALEKLHFCAGEILILLGDINSYPFFVTPGSKPTEPRPPIKPSGPRSRNGGERSRLKREFYDYLTKRNYSANTINSYVSAINRVAEWEITDWKGVYDNIELLCYEYSQGGIKGDKGMIGHNTIISALRRYCEFAGDCKIE